VARRDQSILSGAEQQALLLIREIRSQTATGMLPKELTAPARIAHYVISLYHGHVQLRISRIAPELGVSMRTLQRSFRQTFHTSLKAFQLDARLIFAQYLLSSDPELKMSVIAKQLGYDDPNVFERFFRAHAGTSPHAWSEAERETLRSVKLGKTTGPNS
jgi:AraC-like DNA-binding protein